MRFLTILISLIVGVVLGLVCFSNYHEVFFYLDPFVKSYDPFTRPHRIFPLWVIMAACVAVGFVLGWLVGLTSAYTAPPAKPPAPPVQKKPEHDYLVIDATPAKRGGS